MLAALVLSLATAQARAADAKAVIATGGIGGVYYYYGTQVSEILNKNGIASATAIQTAASVDNMLLLRDKTTEKRGTYFCATVLPDTALEAVKGSLEKFKGNPAKATVLWMMYPNYLHVVTTGETGIKKLSDLAGRRVSTGAPGSGTEFTALNLLRAAGIDPAKFAKWEKLGAKESDEALTNGTVEAYFWSGGLPTGSIVELSNTLSRKGTQLVLVPLPEADPAVVQLRKAFPGIAESLVVPKATYATASDTPTLAFPNMFVCPASMPEELAYKITKATFENVDALRASVKAAKDTTPEGSARFIATSGVPFHPGALRYYREKGLLAIQHPGEKVLAK
jgi:TRAP transporter TAXI family solute receptor